MRVSNITMPNKKFEILPNGNTNGNTCTVIFYDDIKSNSIIDGITGNYRNSWDYEKYSLDTNYSKNLSAQITSNYSEWLQKAKDSERETEANKIRNYRDNLLNECDLKYCNPSKWEEMLDSEKIIWTEYKDILRKIPEQESFPYQVLFPKIPQIQRSLSDYKEIKQSQNKKMLLKYLKENPLIWIDGNTYGVTYEDQQEMALNLNQYQLAISSGIENPKLQWHTVKGICTDWTLENFISLSNAVSNYVYPFINYKDSIKERIYSASTVEEVNEIVIDYSTVKTNS